VEISTVFFGLPSDIFANLPATIARCAGKENAYALYRPM